MVPRISIYVQPHGHKSGAREISIVYKMINETVNRVYHTHKYDPRKNADIELNTVSPKLNNI